MSTRADEGFGKAMPRVGDVVSLHDEYGSRVGDSWMVDESGEVDTGNSVDAVLQRVVLKRFRAKST